MTATGEKETPRTRIAFFGGSFDPPHNGHLAVARAAREALHLDMVLFAPVGAQPLKPNGPAASFEDRCAMTRLAIAGECGFALSLLDAPQPDGAPNYTLDTLHKLRAEKPGAQLFLLLGADSFAMLRNWHGAAEIPFAASLVVASRPVSQSAQNTDNLAEYLPPSLKMAPAASSASSAHDLHAYTLTDAAGRSAEFYLMPGLDVPISATGIRAQLHGDSVAECPDCLPPAVADYIRERSLYQ